jgi:hypothetical protein
LEEATQTKADLESCRDHKILTEYKLSDAQKKLFIGWVPARMLKVQKKIDRHAEDKLEIDRLLATVSNRISARRGKRKTNIQQQSFEDN